MSIVTVQNFEFISGKSTVLGICTGGNYVQERATKFCSLKFIIVIYVEVGNSWKHSK